MFRYCPSCASQNIRFDHGKAFSCPDCGFRYYHNVAAATGCIIRSKHGLLFLVRGKDPGKGKLDLPGGFVDPGEGAFEGLRRELKEELGWDFGELHGGIGAGTGSGAGKAGGIAQGVRCDLFASYANIYPYKNIVYNTCDLFFALDAPELTEADLTLQEGEVLEARFVQPEDVKLDEFAFDSARRAVADYLGR